MVESLAQATVQVFNGENEPITDKIKAVVVKDAIRIFRPTVKIEAGYLVKHFINIGDDEYRVLEANYSEGLRGAIPPSYELRVRNVKNIPMNSRNRQSGHGDNIGAATPGIVNNNYNFGDNGRVYKDSVDNSTNSVTYNNTIYSQILNQLRDEVKNSDLNLVDKQMSENIINNIQSEVSQESPSKIKIQTLLSVLPIGVQAFSAAVELASLFAGS